MNQSKLPGVITAGVIAAALLIGVAKSKGWRASDVSLGSLAASLKPREKAPEDAIYAMLDAARLADPQAYLDCYTDQMKDQLAETLKESGTANFADYLKTSNASVQGVALSPPQTVTAGLAKVRVEYVQFVYLSRSSSGWKISRVDGAERIKTLVPFGTAVTD